MTCREDLNSLRDLDALMLILLLDALQARESGDYASPTFDWTELPNFGGDAPKDTTGVWSWDANRLLIGTCAEDLEIVERPK